jgi:hypothetical protein
MKKITTILCSLLLIFQYSFTYAQCKTCKLGRPNDNDTAVVNSSSYSPQQGNTNRIENGNQALALSYSLLNTCGLNYASASVLIETRSALYSFNDSGSGFPAPLNIVGLCGINHPQIAYVYYDASYTEAAAPATTVTIKNPALVTATYPATLIGTSGSKCWGEVGTACYRATVTAAISGAGAYSIVSINGFANAAWEVDGATLIIVYTVPTATYTGSIALWDGCWENSTGASYLYTATGVTTCAAASTATMFGIYGDDQDNTCAGKNTETFNGVTKTFWNSFWNYDAIPVTLTSGQNSFGFNSYTNNLGCDCWLWEVAGLYYQNTTCVACAAGSCVLPIELESFSAECQNNNPLLKWTTATENNNDHFTIERTEDGQHFINVATIKGAGNSSSPHNYSVVDDNPASGNSYYRISQTDFDGTTNVLSTTAFTPCENVTTTVINNSIDIQINSASGGKYGISLTNTMGEVVLNQTQNAVPGINSFKLTPKVSKGIYILQITTPGRVIYKKIELGL